MLPTPRAKDTVTARLEAAEPVPPATTWSEVTLAVGSLAQLRTLTVDIPWLSHRSRRWRLVVGGPARDDLVRHVRVAELGQLQHQTWRRLGRPRRGDTAQELSVQTAAPVTLTEWLAALGAGPLVGGRRLTPTWAELLHLPAAELAGVRELLSGASLSLPRGLPDLVGLSSAAQAVGTLRRQAGRVVVEVDGIGTVRLSAEGLSEQTTHQLRGARLLLDDPTVHDGPVQHADFLVRCALAGIPVLVPRPAPVVRQLLGEELAGSLERTVDTDLRDDLAREQHCLDLAATALRAHRGRPVERVAQDGVRVLAEVDSPEQARQVCVGVARQTLPVHGVTLLDRSGGQVPDRAWGELAGRPVGVVPAEDGSPWATVLAGVRERYALLVTATTRYDELHLQHLALGLVSTGADVVTGTPELAYLPSLDATVRQARPAWTMGSSSPADSLLTSTEVLRRLVEGRGVSRAADLAGAAVAHALTVLAGPSMSGIRVVGAADSRIGDLDELLHGSTWWSDGFAPRRRSDDGEPVRGAPRRWPQGVPASGSRQHRVYDARRQGSRSYWRRSAAAAESGG